MGISYKSGKIPLRTAVLVLGFLLALVVFAMVHLGPRTVSIDARGTPLGQVIASFERQAKISVLTNVDPSTPVTLYLQKVTVPIALRKLGGAVGAEFRVGYFFAPTKSQLLASAADWESGAFKGRWYQLRGPMVEGPKEHPRFAPWNVKTEAAANLGSYLEQASVSTGLCLALNGDPATAVPSAPKSGSIDQGLRHLAHLAHMQCADYAMLVDLKSLAAGEAQARPGEQPGSASLPEPAQFVQFLKSRLDEMPPERREEARQKVAAMEKLAESMKDLSPEERAKQFFEQAPPPPGQGRSRRRSGASVGGGGATTSESGQGGTGGTASKQGGGEGSSADKGTIDFEEVERQVEMMESEMTPTQRADFFREYVEKRSAPTP